MHHTDPNDPFFTPEVVEYMRQKNLENISYEENVEVLQDIIDVYSMKPEIRYDWTGDDVVHEAETLYFTRKELKEKRLEAAKLVEVDGNVVTLDEVFAILSHRDKGFKEEYLENEALAQKNCPDHVEKLRRDFFVTGYYPGRDQGPQTEEEWEELLAEIDEEDCIPDEEVRRMCEEWLSCA
ncbi:MAG: hypothetical protein J6W75_13250 [Bacteroidaceae bacterium]|nr:hypothetical protein [Bacteroidaceae bacterium]